MESLSENKLPSIHELVGEPTLEDLNNKVAQYGNTRGTLDGKFIRIGGVVLICPQVECEAAPGMQDKEPQHADIATAGFTHIDSSLQNKIKKAEEAVYQESQTTDLKILDYSLGILDAGRFYFDPANNQLIFYDRSMKFGHADEAGRQKTAALVQEKTGSELSVRTEN